MPITPFIISPADLSGVRGPGPRWHIGRNRPVLCRFCPDSAVTFAPYVIRSPPAERMPPMAASSAAPVSGSPLPHTGWHPPWETTKASVKRRTPCPVMGYRWAVDGLAGLWSRSAEAGFPVKLRQTRTLAGVH